MNEFEEVMDFTGTEVPQSVVSPQEIEKTKQKAVIAEILKNLSNFNPDIIENDDESIRRYVLKETPGAPIPLSTLQFNLGNNLETTVKFQREPDDHKKKTPQQIVSDYLSGQFMGHISCYVNQNTSKPKLVIDGRHRLTHLDNFLKGDLTLRDKEASQVWSANLKKLFSLKGDPKINKIVNTLQSCKVPPVKYTDLPPALQAHIITNVTIEVKDIQVECYDENEDRVYDKIDINKVEELYYRKFLRINQNSANMQPDDIIWGCASSYNTSSRRIATKPFFNTLFNIKLEKDQRKLNELLFSTLFFLDGRVKWGSGGKSLVSKINDPVFFDMKKDGDASNFNKYFSKIVEHFENYFSNGLINLPEEMNGIANKGTNIKYMIYFMYMIHKMTTNGTLKYKLYDNDGSGRQIPSIFLKNIIEYGARIIVAANVDKNNPTLTNIPSNTHKINTDGLTDTYLKYPNLFINLSDYRKNNRDREKEIDPVFELLVNVCCNQFDPQYTF